jgi:hypothetical protein
MKDQIKKCILLDLPCLVVGKSGWGKSEMVSQSVNELGYELVTVIMSQIPAEDIGGLPLKSESNDSYTYLLPHWAQEILNNPTKKYVVFLDEIDSAPPSALNAIFSLVLDRKMAGVFIPNMMVVAACLPFVNKGFSNIPTSLINRFIVNYLEENSVLSVQYLTSKYGELVDTNILSFLMGFIKEASPRTIESALKLLTNSNFDYSLINGLFNGKQYKKIEFYFSRFNLHRKIDNSELNHIIESGFVLTSTGIYVKLSDEERIKLIDHKNNNFQFECINDLLNWLKGNLNNVYYEYNRKYLFLDSYESFIVEESEVPAHIYNSLPNGTIFRYNHCDYKCVSNDFTYIERHCHGHTSNEFTDFFGYKNILIKSYKKYCLRIEPIKWEIIGEDEYYFKLISVNLFGLWDGSCVITNSKFSKCLAETIFTENYYLKYLLSYNRRPLFNFLNKEEYLSLYKIDTKEIPLDSSYFNFQSNKTLGTRKKSILIPFIDENVEPDSSWFKFVKPVIYIPRKFIIDEIS